MLEKHKNLIKNCVFKDKEEINECTVAGCYDGKLYMVIDNQLEISFDSETYLRNVVNSGSSFWNIKSNDGSLYIAINIINNTDVVSIITINDKYSTNSNIVTIKQTPTEAYVSLGDKATCYNLDNCNTLMYLNIIDDYCNRRGLLQKCDRKDIYNCLIPDIDQIFTLIENNKEMYIDRLKHEQNNLNAEYVMRDKKIKKKMKMIDNYCNKK